MVVRAPTAAQMVDVVAYGAPARRALAAAITAAQQGDRLAPVTVIVPSALAGTTLKRALAAELGGLLGVGFESLPGLAARLATPRLAAEGRPALDALTAQAIASGVLADRPGPFAAVADHPSTIAAVVDTLAELRALSDGELGALAGTSDRGADVVGLHRGYVRATAAWSDDDHQLAVAAQAVASGDPAALDVGTVVLHLPRRLGRRELELVAAFAAREQLHVIVGATGRAGADSATGEVLDALASIGLPAPAASIPAVELAVGTTIVTAPDPAEEVRHAVRLTREALAGGTPAERIAIVSRVHDPYALLAHEELQAAGIAHSAPSPTRLAQSMAGRTLLGLLGWRSGGARRDDLMRVLRGAPVRDGEGRRARPDRWDRIAREAGVVSGIDQWRARLGAARAAREQRVIAKGEELVDDERLARIDALSAFVEHIDALVDPGARVGWRPLAHWARTVLERSLGGFAVVAHWLPEEQSARAQIVDLLDRLARLPEIGPPPDAERFLRVLEHELRRGSGRVGRFGAGVTVGRLVDAVGADLDLVIVLGAAEGVFPPRRPDDAVLPARHRRAVAALRPRGSSRDEEERDVFAVLAAAPRRVLTTPAADPRSQREQHPAPWLLELDGVHVALPSFEAWLGEGRAPATPTERDVAELLAAHRAGAALDALPAITANGIGRGLAVARSRATGGFDEWAGHVGAHPLLSGELAEHRSPTGLESWATCPFRYFLDKVLGVRSLDDPGTVETITGRDRGSLVHEVLERFITARLDVDPTRAWDADARSELAAIADEVEDTYRGHGRTGRQLLWDPEWRNLQRHLAAIIDHGTVAPELAGLVPIAVEHGFGFEGDSKPAVEVRVGDGPPLRFGGRIDRVDASPDRKRVVVVDYKTTPGTDYRRMAEDPVDRGRRMQLPIYALAARELVPEAESVAAYYWFVHPRASIELRGLEFDDDTEQRFREVLGTVVGGIEQGLFPARPGDDTWLPGVGETYDACRWCDYNRVCPTGRADRWERVRVHGSLARYADLAEGHLDADEEGDDA